ncbi:uncharacterized protein Dmoj_GI26826 [Drosophila mojavensis]|uniref:Uncharacterized protein n=1 Tax=Drosophila mojavensis TaxID=7230 RepID=A0A0Q9XR72_DROMO|nr:uncharacterized protein Dmoj_GI26826 [Drosophila mojavensis]
MRATYQNYMYYKKARQRFACTVYSILFVWLALTLMQIAVIALVIDARYFFYMNYYISFIFFGVGILLFGLFILFETLRFIIVLNFVLAIIIVESQIIALFALVARVFWIDVLAFFSICFVLLWIFILFGSILPRDADLTLDVAVVFIIAFVFLAIGIFFLMVHFAIPRTGYYSYLVFEIAITIMILAFVMYHAQTINGGRFAEMRLNDALLGSLILFHDFLIIYWLTFYWQILVRPFTPNNWILLANIEDVTNVAPCAYQRFDVFSLPQETNAPDKPPVQPPAPTPIPPPTQPPIPPPTQPPIPPPTKRPTRPPTTEPKTYLIIYSYTRLSWPWLRRSATTETLS